MSEPPDFDQIAHVIIKRIWGNDVLESRETVRAMLVAQIRSVWNLRGAADLAAVDDIAHTNEKPIAEAIRSLDR